jgi:hypothetical protein
MHGCLESFITCVKPAEIFAWAAPLSIEFDFVRFYEHMWAREGWRSHSLFPHSGIDCRPILAAAKSSDLLNGPNFASSPSPATAPITTAMKDDAVPVPARETGDARSKKAEQSRPGGSEAYLGVFGGTDRTKESETVTSRGLCSAKQILVLYSYFEVPRAARNLRTFLEETKGDWRKDDVCNADLPIELVLIISGHRCSVLLPVASNVRILRIDNTGSDFGAYSEALASLGIAVHLSLWRKRYSYIVFINSSCRGPFLPAYVRGLHWTTPFVSRITERVKLVGPSIHFIPGLSVRSLERLGMMP